jgi:hypothetical protein
VLALVVLRHRWDLYGERPAGRLAQLAKITIAGWCWRSRAAEHLSQNCNGSLCRSGNLDPTPNAPVDRPGACADHRQRKKPPAIAMSFISMSVQEGQHRVVAALAVMADETGAMQRQQATAPRSGLEADQDEQACDQFEQPVPQAASVGSGRQARK